MKNKLLLLLLSASILTACQNDKADKKEKVKSEEKSQKTSEQKEAATDIAYKEGQYKAVAQGVDGDVEVIVKLGKDKIESVEIGEENETSGICEAVYYTIPQAIVDNQSLAIDNVSGATITSAAVKTAAAKAIEEGSSKEVVDALKKVEVPVDVKDEEFDYDVVIAGGGFSGIVSAYRAASNGAKVALVEKNGFLGGTLITASGNMLAAPTEADKETMKTGWLNRSWSQDLNPIDMEMLDALIDVSPKLMQVYDEIGVDYRTESSEKDGSITVKINPNEKSKKNAEAITIPSKKANAKGAPNLIATFVKKLNNLGVDIYINTPATK